MMKKISVVIAVMVCFWLVRLGTNLRYIGYEQIPELRIDEFNYVWQGLSLRKTGVPIGWVAFFDVYEGTSLPVKKGVVEGFGLRVEGKLMGWKEFTRDGAPMEAVEQIDYGKGTEHMLFAAPFFDHSPLGGLIYSWGENPDIQNLIEVKPENFRRTAITLSVITAVLVGILAYVIGGNAGITVLAVALYSTVPTYILATRTAYLENVVPIFALTGIIAAVAASKGIILRGAGWVLAGLGLGLAMVTKEPAVGFAFGTIIVCLIKRIERKYILALAIGIVVPLMVYIGWGTWLQKEVFWGIISANSGRADFGAMKLVTMMMALRFKDFPIDGWWIWGLSCLFIAAAGKENSKWLWVVVPAVGNLVIIMLMGSNNYPWYYMSLIPFAAIAMAVVAWELLANPNAFAAVAFFLIPVSSSFYWGYSSIRQGSTIMVYRILFGVFMASLAARKWSNQVWIKVVWSGVVILLLYQVSKWNVQGFQFVVANFGKLAIPSLPTF